MRGFSLVELLIVISIGVVVVAAAIPLYGNLHSSTQIGETTTQIVQTLRTARQKSISGLNNSAHGVYLDIEDGENHAFILYQGDSFAARQAQYDRREEISISLSIVNATLNLTGEDIDINFSRGKGLPNNIGSFNIVHDVLDFNTITINELGLIEE